jgi:hypothetical protein
LALEAAVETAFPAALVPASAARPASAAFAAEPAGALTRCVAPVPRFDVLAGRFARGPAFALELAGFARELPRFAFEPPRFDLARVGFAFAALRFGVVRLRFFPPPRPLLGVRGFEPLVD